MERGCWPSLDSADGHAASSRTDHSQTGGLHPHQGAVGNSGYRPPGMPLRVVSPISFTSGYNWRQWTLALLPSLFKESTDEGSLSLTADLAGKKQLSDVPPIRAPPVPSKASSADRPAVQSQQSRNGWFFGAFRNTYELMRLRARTPESPREQSIRERTKRPKTVDAMSRRT